MKTYKNVYIHNESVTKFNTHSELQQQQNLSARQELKRTILIQ